MGGPKLLQQIKEELNIIKERWGYFMFIKITEFMDTKLSTPMAKLAEQRHLRAIRDEYYCNFTNYCRCVNVFSNCLSSKLNYQKNRITQFIQANQAKILLLTPCINVHYDAMRYLVLDTR